MARLHFAGSESDAFRIDETGDVHRLLVDRMATARASRQRRKWLRKQRRQQRDWQKFLLAYRR